MRKKEEDWRIFERCVGKYYKDGWENIREEDWRLLRGRWENIGRRMREY
jgi:hypothetical protein